MRGFGAAVLVLLVGIGGCQPAERYGPRSASEPPAKRIVEEDARKPETIAPPNPEIQWIDIDNPPKPDVLIEFVHAEKAPETWNKLPSFWNEPHPLLGKAEASKTTPADAAGSPLQVIQIKVPLGLPDPREHIPSGESLTLGKWKLGQQLFFDDSWLEAKAGTSCATCHQPDHGFANRERTSGDAFNAPSLINCVYNRWQFWDGRAVLLEEAAQRTLEDERESNPPKPFHHAWSGVIARLRNKAAYHEQFNRVFGKPAGEEDGAERANITQDTLGRALACYLRTLLAGDSIHDRALHEQARKHSPTLAPVHYQAVLDDAEMTALGRDKAKKAETAEELMRGYLLFLGLDKNRPLVNCSHCHSGPTFSDNQFHNLGIGLSSRPGQESGRFTQVPVGQKNRYLIDAYKTPTLRNLARTQPYFHNGSISSPREVVEFYNNGAGRNSHLDPELRGTDRQTRLLGLNASEIEALVLFLNALNGREVDPAVKTPPGKGS